MYYLNGNLMYDIKDLKVLVDKYIQSELDMESDAYKEFINAISKVSKTDRKKVWKYLDTRMQEEKKNGKKIKKTKWELKDILQLIFGSIFIIGFIIALVIAFDIKAFIFILIIVLCIVISSVSVEEKSLKSEKILKNNREKIIEKLKHDGFNSSISIPYSENYIGAAFMVDEENKKIALCHYIDTSVEYISFNQIIDVEILKDNANVMKGGVGRAVVGGVLAGGVGAIVGANTRDSKELLHSLKIRIITNDIKTPLYVIDLIYNEISVKNHEYNTILDIANKIYSLIFSIVNENGNQNINVSEDKAIDQIEKLSILKEKMIITQEEFELKKKELLNKI